MSISQLVNKVRSAEEATRKASRWFAQDPASFSAKLSLESMQRHQSQLKAELDAAYASAKHEVCRFRYLVELESIPIRWLADSLSAFQEVLAHGLSVIDGIPVRRGSRPAKECYERSELGLAFCFDGSIGLGLVAPAADPNLLPLIDGYGDIGKSLELLATLSSIKTASSLNAKSDELGFSTVACFQKLLSVHREHELPFAYEWKESEKFVEHVYSLGEITRLLNLIGQSREKQESLESFRAVGTEILTKNNPRIKVQLEDLTELTIRVPLEYPLSKLRVQVWGTFEVKKSSVVHFEMDAKEQNVSFELTDISWDDDGEEK